MKKTNRRSHARAASIAALFCLTGLSASIHAEAFKDVAPPHLKEFEEALKLKPDIDNGRRLFKHYCVTCHGPEGWGVAGSGYPEIAGQLKDVIIKQLADFRAGNRDNPIMRAFSSPRSLGGPQEIADVAAYVASLPMSPRNEKGFTLRIEEGKKLYKELCADCHGDRGEGDPKRHAPRLQGQHYSYLMRQFNWIRNGYRRNANKKMVEQIQDMTPSQQVAIMSYLSNLTPDHVAPEGWRNPDFDDFDRSWRPASLH
jgi:cytochrome c553